MPPGGLWDHLLSVDIRTKKSNDAYRFLGKQLLESKDMQSERQHLSLLCDIGELSNLISETKDIDSFLQQTVQLVASHLRADVGSIYMFDETRSELVLKATIGLNPLSVDQVKMKVGEGLVGWTLDKMEPVLEGTACESPRFKFFEACDEEGYNSFLSVPISRANERIGVLVVQHAQSDFFDHSDVMALRAIAAQLAGTIANARLMMMLNKPQPPDADSDVIQRLRFIRGEATVSGFACAPAAKLKPADPLLEHVPDEIFFTGIADFRRAVQKTMGQLKRLQEQLVRRLPESAALIFESHYMILKDPRFVQKIGDDIIKGLPAPHAVRRTGRHFIQLFDESANPYIREKTHDIEDLVRRLLFNLRKEKPGGESPMDHHIVIASQLYPSDLLKMASESVAGIILVSGGVTSHVAIIARSLHIPMVIAKKSELLQIPEGTMILMDAEVGTIYLDPSEHVRRQFQDRNQVRIETAGKSTGMDAETRTADGVRVELLANINLLSELELARELKAEGIGLYRSEFPFIVRSVFPSEEEQLLVYTSLFQEMGDRPVLIRTLDVGGDKVLPYLNIPKEQNPELGLRSIRFSLRYRDIFDQQIRAILRAGAQAGSLGIMFPMISSIDEFETARTAVHEAIAALAKENLAHHASPALGAMIELPAIVEIMDELAQCADFFSIGTNDFIQYMLAVDRTNENVSEYYQPFHPAVLRALAHIARKAAKHDRPLSVCGEAAHQPAFLPFLIGIGIRRLSVDPQFLPVVQKAISSVTVAEAEKYAQQLLEASTLSAIQEITERLRLN